MQNCCEFILDLKEMTHFIYVSVYFHVNIMIDTCVYVWYTLVNSLVDMIVEVSM